MEIAKICKEKKLKPFFDTAYQGFVTGDLDVDGTSLRYFIDQGFQLVVAQSFAKIMGLYGERIGALHIVCKDKDTATRVESQIKLLIRANYSSPPLNGARIAGMVLSDPDMKKEWLDNLKSVTDRITAMRELLKNKLTEIGAKSSTGNWDHITTQIGMFSFTGLTTA